jgi:hypothetical protein
MQLEPGLVGATTAKRIGITNVDSFFALQLPESRAPLYISSGVGQLEDFERLKGNQPQRSLGSAKLCQPDLQLACSRQSRVKAVADGVLRSLHHRLNRSRQKMLSNDDVRRYMASVPAPCSL